MNGAPALVHTKDEARRAAREARARGARVALVPTMGALHEGHLSLVDDARAAADWVAMSIFVNPLQFGPAEDLDRYPRTLERDLELAASRGVDLVFAPAAAEMYPGGEPGVWVASGGTLAERLDGAARPGHFRGVLTVVAKLFGIFRPDVAVFGQKDFQQAALISRMAADLDQGVEVRVAPVVREADGLAMSSRNVYLSADERARALSLSRGLERPGGLFAAGERDAEVLRAALGHEMDAAGVQGEYAEVVDPRTLEPVARAEVGTVVLVAARVGATRLIDNALLG
jgi:pantoate--beta-alanine ligase